MTMPTISDSIFSVVLPSGNKAIYSVQPQHLNDYPGSTLTQRAIERGTQVAHEKGGKWYQPGGWIEITDIRTLALIDRCPDA
jgi:hypothetical protein